MNSTDAKAFLAGSFPLSIETPDDIATKVLTALFYGLPLTELDTFRERVQCRDARRHPARHPRAPPARSAVHRAGGHARR